MIKMINMWTKLDIDNEKQSNRICSTISNYIYLCIVQQYFVSKLWSIMLFPWGGNGKDY